MIVAQAKQFFIGSIAVSCAFLAGPAFGETPQATPALGLYDSEGYAYYPIETHIFAPSFTQANLNGQGQIAGKPDRPVDVVQARRTQSADQPHSQAVAIRFHTTARVSTRGPMPSPNSMIMDPWNIGVFR